MRYEGKRREAIDGRRAFDARAKAKIPKQMNSAFALFFARMSHNHVSEGHIARDPNGHYHTVSTKKKKKGQTKTTTMAVRAGTT